MHLLDDGFQHRELARAMDVVLVTAEDLEDPLLPAGNRREWLWALRRADAVVVREEERALVELQVREWMREDARIWVVQRKLRFAEGAGALGSGLRPVAFCAIARPGSYWAMLAAAGCELVGKVAFGDHHRYSSADMKRLVRVAGECGATGFVTTEKDAVKLALDSELMSQLEAVGPVCVAALDATFLDEADVMRELEARL